ncbi:glycosyltransferase, partial [bacterium]|nr:glycosyltransferase [bacterium]
MRIIYLINALTYGGAQFLLLDLCRHFSGLGGKVIVAAFRDGEVGETLRKEGFDVRILTETALDIVGFSKLCSLISAFKPDILHTHLFRATFWGRLAAKFYGKAKIVTSVHGTESENFYRLERRMASFSNLIIFPSLALSEWYIKTIRPIPSYRYHVLPPGTMVEELSQVPSISRKPKIGTLSRLHPVKGLDVLIKACFNLFKSGF